jgi:hypothetical protein
MKVFHLYIYRQSALHGYHQRMERLLAGFLCMACGRPLVMTHFWRPDLTSWGETSVYYFVVAKQAFLVGHPHLRTFFPAPNVLNFMVLVGDFSIHIESFSCCHLVCRSEFSCNWAWPPVTASQAQDVVCML